MNARRPPLELVPYAVTIFTGAFLLLLVQPLIGKYILPWFGGSPGVWTTCLLFFQVVLLAGYAYAHALSSRFRLRAQVVAHATLLIAALLLLPVTPADSWKPHGADHAVWQILLLLTANLGLPYFVLSATGPLIQHWFSRAHLGPSPYRLYALSNLGSLLALVAFPFWFEPHWSRRAQGTLWGWGLAAYALGCAWCALRLWQAEPAAPQAGSAVNERVGLIRKVFWLLLPACASMLLLATTNKICQDVAVIPFLWSLPLGLYLLSFIICFDSPRWYVRPVFALALIGALAMICLALFRGTDWSIEKQIALYCGGLFICCMVCHGELYRLKPSPARLTDFYLLIAAGGALGGILVAIVAPLLFPAFYELHLALFLCGLLLFLICAGDRDPLHVNHWRLLACVLILAAFVVIDLSLASLAQRLTAIPKAYWISTRVALWLFLAVLAGSWLAHGKARHFQHWHLLACLSLGAGLLALGMALGLQGFQPNAERVHRARNFYGVLAVYEHRKTEPEAHHFLLQHGRITHGLQFVGPSQADWLTTYYGRESGIGLAMESLKQTARRVGLVGLGTGTLTAYAQPGDYFRVYEINPEVERLAKSRFTFLNHCAGQTEVIIGDARLSLEREPPQQFDLLALDAFSSDAIPVHLLTLEAFQLYERHLQTNGIIAVHVSNHYLDLEPVLSNVARHFRYQVAVVDYDETEEEWWLYSSTWVLLTHDAKLLNSHSIQQLARPPKPARASLPLWTDDFASLFQIVRQSP